MNYTHSTIYILIAIAIAAAVTFALRAFPFVIFRGERKMPKTIENLGQTLPAAIMAVLIIYCLKDSFTKLSEYGLPGLLAVLVVGITYKWKHNTLVSIVLGTAVYMILCRCL